MENLRVYLIWQNNLMRDATLAILQQSDVILIGETQGVPKQEVILGLNPDVVLFEAEAELKSPILSMFSQICCPRMVSISLTDNQIHIYSHEERQLNDLADLIEALSH